MDYDNEARQLQIVQLLNRLGDRLSKLEEDREDVMRAIKENNQAQQAIRKDLTNIQDHSESFEEAIMNAKLAQSIFKDQIASQDKSRDELMTTLASVRKNYEGFEDRLERAVNDRVKLMRRIERIESIATETQDALRAKALVLLTDEAIARHSSLPVSAAVTKEEQEAVLSANPMYEHDINRERSIVAANDDAGNGFAAAAKFVSGVLIVVMAVLGGWYFGAHNQGVSLPEVEIVNNNPLPQQTLIEPASGDPLVSFEMFDEPDQPPVLQAEAMPDPVFVEDIAAIEVEDVGPVIETELATQMTPDGALPAVAKVLEDKAYRGDPEAQHDLATLYVSGQNDIKSDFSRAAFWFERAAEQGIANARYNLGVLYHQGLGVTPSMDKALGWYKQAAELGHPEAQYNLGIAHIEGLGAPYNPVLATRYFENAAQGGIIEAAFNLGLIYENGLTGDTRPDEALFWYRLAADQGNEDAQTALRQLAQRLDIDPEQAGRSTGQSSARAVEQGSFEPVEVLDKSIRAHIESSDRILVKNIQEELTQLGLYMGNLNGVNDSATRDAIRTWQAENGYDITGIATRELLSNLEQ